MTFVYMYLEVPRDTPTRDVVVALRRAGARLATAARRRLDQAHRVRDEGAVVEARHLVDDADGGAPREEGACLLYTSPSPRD